MLEPLAGYPLARLTTVRTGGAAERFARAGSRQELVELLEWARERRLEVNVVGSGSNLLVADGGVRGLVIKLDRELARIERDGLGLRCGGGARQADLLAARPRLGRRGHRRADRARRARDRDGGGRRRSARARAGGRRRRQCLSHSPATRWHG